MGFTGNDLLFGSNQATMGFTAPKALAEAKADGELGTMVGSVRGRVTAFEPTHRRTLKWDEGKQKYEQGKPLYWSADNKPTEDVTERKVLDPMLTLQTDFRNWEGTSAREDDEDLGVRRVFLKGRKAPDSALDAVKAACLAAKVRKIQEGDYVEITCTGEGKLGKNKSINPPKLFKAEYWPASNPPAWAAEVDAGLDLDGDYDGDEDNPFDE